MFGFWVEHHNPANSMFLGCLLSNTKRKNLVHVHWVHRIKMYAPSKWKAIYKTHCFWWPNSPIQIHFWICNLVNRVHISLLNKNLVKTHCWSGVHFYSMCYMSTGQIFGVLLPHYIWVRLCKTINVSGSETGMCIAMILDKLKWVHGLRN